MRKKLRLAALISGGASTAAAIFKACGTERLPDVEMPLVIASNNSAGECLRELPNCPQIVVIRRRDSKSRHFFGQMILAHLRMYNIDFVGQYGWMPFTPDCVVHAFEGRIANQHPGNPRWFGGSKMDGIRVSCARLNFVRAVNRDFFTEAVTHWVTSVLDGGAIIKSRRIRSTPGSSRSSGKSKSSFCATCAVEPLRKSATIHHWSGRESKKFWLGPSRRRFSIIRTSSGEESSA